MRAQAGEERAHAMRIYDYVYERDGRVTLDAINAPQAEWLGPKTAFEDAYEHEVTISGMTDDLVVLACEENDNATENMLQWFVAEQVEEEATAHDILNKLELIGEDGPSILMASQELGQRRSGGGGEEGKPESDFAE